MWLHVVVILGIFFVFRWWLEHLTVKNLSDKYVLITGCGSGFGNLLARQLDQHGLQVLAACHTGESAKRLKSVTSQRLHTIVLEVTDSDSVAHMKQWVDQQVGSKDHLGFGAAFTNKLGHSVTCSFIDRVTLKTSLHEVKGKEKMGR